MRGSAVVWHASMDLYLDHVRRFGLPGGFASARVDATCTCDPTLPDRACDVGEALFRVRARDMVRKGVA